MSNTRVRFTLRYDVNELRNDMGGLHFNSYAHLLVAGKPALHRCRGPPSPPTETTREEVRFSALPRFV